MNIIYIEITEHENHPELLLWSVKARHDEVVLEDDQVGAGRVLPPGADDAGGHRALLLEEHSPARLDAPAISPGPEQDLLERQLRGVLALRSAGGNEVYL